MTSRRTPSGFGNGHEDTPLTEVLLTQGPHNGHLVDLDQPGVYGLEILDLQVHDHPAGKLPVPLGNRAVIVLQDREQDPSPGADSRISRSRRPPRSQGPLDRRWTELTSSAGRSGAGSIPSKPSKPCMAPTTKESTTTPSPDRSPTSATASGTTSKTNPITERPHSNYTTTRYLNYSWTMRKSLTLITGGTRGIGKAIALRLARDGHDLVLGYASDDDSAAETRLECQEYGATCRTVRGDLTADEGIEALFRAAAEIGPLQTVVNNAGATLHIDTLVDTPADVIRHVIDLNLISAVLIARRAVQELADGGVLVNISSGAATTGAPREYVHYAAAKAGVDALTKGLAVEALSRGIRVIGVAPGTVQTDIHAQAGDPNRSARVGATHPMGRVGRPEEIAGVVAFAMSEDASYTAGTTIRVAGGQ